MEDIKFELVRKLTRTKFKYSDLKNLSQLNSFSPPSVFVGSGLKYPLVNVGILSPVEREENAWIYDDAKYWAQNNFGINEVINLREGLLNSRFQSNVKDSRLNKKFVNIAKEIAIASKPVEIELELKNRINLGRKSDRVVTPNGLRAELKKAMITSNVKVERKLDSVMNDEVKSNEGIEILYKNNFDEYALSKILSVGVLGLKKDKKFVPTRWSITAIDDIIGKNILERVRDYKIIEDYGLFFGQYLGNQYMIMFFPENFSYELFELYFPGSSWNPSRELKASTDFENYAGRKNYAFNTAGGYYATRLPILEYLDKIKRQAGVLVVRIETPGYWAALGVWVVRESVRKAMNNAFWKFATKEELINSAKSIGKIKYNFDYSKIFNKSRVLNELKEQKRLIDWFKV
jgi:hypothetical protein